MIPGTPTEYCQNEVFKAKCGHDRVIVMTNASYGRMVEKNRCITKNYGYIGCGSSVLGAADHFCSGKRSCEIRIPNSLIDEAQAEAEAHGSRKCPDDFKSYLRAGYRCVDGNTIHVIVCCVCACVCVLSMVCTDRTSATIIRHCVQCWIATLTDISVQSLMLSSHTCDSSSLTFYCALQQSIGHVVVYGYV